jgi:RNA polymerase sigma-70 factor (ECF subfamily)
VNAGTGTDFDDDAVLVAALRAGDEAAFAWLVDRYTPSLRRLAGTYVSIPAVAEEAVQDTWLAVITGVERFEQRSSVKTWLHGILVNVARAKGVREHRSIPFASLATGLEDGETAVDPDRFQSSRDRWPGHWAAPPMPWDETPEGRALALETLRIVRTAVDTLAPAQRAVISLRDLEGWSADEVCNALGISDTNQRVLLHRARSRVRSALEAHVERGHIERGRT